MSSSSSQPHKYIDVEQVIKTKNARLHKFMPRFILRYIKRTLHEDQVNQDLYDLRNDRGVDMFAHFLEMKNVKLNVVGLEKLSKDGTYILASNHPFGGPDGVALVAAFGRHFGNVRFVVNDILLNLPNLDGVFLPVNKHGANPKEYSKYIDAAFDDRALQMIIFPAGLVSRKIKGKIQDLPWRKTVISKAKQSKRDIVPVFIDGKNTNFFYNLANLRRRLGIRANIEMFFLVDEFYKHVNETITIRIGDPIPYTQFDNSKRPDEWAAWVREKVYEMSNQK